MPLRRVCTHTSALQAIHMLCLNPCVVLKSHNMTTDWTPVKWACHRAQAQQQGEQRINKLMTFAEVQCSGGAEGEEMGLHSCSLTRPGWQLHKKLEACSVQTDMLCACVSIQSRPQWNQDTCLALQSDRRGICYQVMSVQRCRGTRLKHDGGQDKGYWVLSSLDEWLACV